MMFVHLIIFALLFKINEAIIGYDCGSSSPNITTYSLLDSGACDFQDEQVNSSSVFIELIQMADFRSIPIIQCKIEIHRTVFDCGMFGHLIPTENAEQQYIKEISHEQCKFIHETGIFKYDNIHTISDLKINSTTAKGIDFAGSAEGRSCTGASYADNFGSWNKVFVHGLIKITLIQNMAKVNLNTDKLMLSSGVVCKFSERHCTDIEGGSTYWDVLPQGECFKNSYDILFKGIAIKYFSTSNKEIVYAVNANEITFALAIKNTEVHCNRELIRTEHPKLFIAEKDNNFNAYFYNTDVVSAGVNSVNLDIFTYVNSKFVYVERHLRSQINDLYINLLTEKCELERKVIQNSLSIASISPDEFAFNIMKKPGYMAKLAGEVVHLIKCLPRNVKILHLEQCYSYLPVAVNNETWFLTPKTHILLKKATKINCNSIIPTYYKIGENWIKNIPKPVITSAPNVLKPNTEIRLTFKSIDNLATSGVYAQGELDKLQEQLMFPMEKAALLNIVAKEIAGESTGENIFSENTLTHIAENTWNKIINKLTTWGSFSSVIIMILIILHIVKLMIDTIVRGYALHAIYGWSIRLIGAIFGSFTHLFSALERKNNETLDKKQKKNQEEVILEEIKIDKARHLNPILKESISGPVLDERITNSILHKPNIADNPLSLRAPSSSIINSLPLRIPPPLPKRLPECLNNFQNTQKKNVSFFSLSLE